MKVVSLFAGIGGFDLGFERAGFEIVAHVERDEKCRKLLASKWPNAVALDDVCTAGAHNLPACDVITFGFPCQDLSVAGKRAGMGEGTRSGLFYQATRIINELKPSYCLFENVPGLFSSDGGRDFARVLKEMERIGYHGGWRVLDAQWLGVAQRRRRVFGLFSLLDFGAERCAEILSIRESLRGHPAPSREKGKVAPALAASGVGAGRTGNERTEADFCIQQPIGIDEEQNASENLMGCLKARMESIGFQGAVAIGGQINMQGSKGNAVADNGEVAFTLNAMHGHVMHSVAVAGTLDGKCCAANLGSQANECEFIVPEKVNTLTSRMQGSTGWAPYNETEHLISTVPSVEGFRMQSFGEYVNYGTASCMKQRDNKDATDLAVAYPINGMTINKELRDRQTTGIGMDGDPSPTLRGQGMQHAVCFGGDVARTLSARHDSSPCADRGMDVVAVEASTEPITFKPNQSEQARSINIGHDIAGTLAGAGGGNGLSVAFQQNQLGEVRTGSVAGTLNQNSNASGRNTPMMNCGMAVRRLTPTECEKLQGFSPGWTEGFSDSTRYKMLGNAVCVNVSEWIARRMMDAMKNDN